MAEDPRIEYLRCRIGANRTMAAEIVRDMDTMKPKPPPRPAEPPHLQRVDIVSRLIAKNWGVTRPAQWSDALAETILIALDDHEAAQGNKATGHEVTWEAASRTLSMVEADRALLTRLSDKVRDLARQQNELQNEIVKMKASREAARAITELDAVIKILG